MPFRVFKLRTMVDGADARKAELAEHNEADGPLFKMANDPRDGVGAILRSTRSTNCRSSSTCCVER